MQYKFIDSKNKEMYFNQSILKEEQEQIEERYNFWKTMDLLALQNMAAHKNLFR